LVVIPENGCSRPPRFFLILAELQPRLPEHPHNFSIHCLFGPSLNTKIGFSVDSPPTMVVFPSDDLFFRVCHIPPCFHTPLLFPPGFSVLSPQQWGSAFIFLTYFAVTFERTSLDSGQSPPFGCNTFYLYLLLHGIASFFSADFPFITVPYFFFVQQGGGVGWSQLQQNNSLSSFISLPSLLSFNLPFSYLPPVCGVFFGQERSFCSGLFRFSLPSPFFCCRSVTPAIPPQFLVRISMSGTVLFVDQVKVLIEHDRQLRPGFSCFFFPLFPV